ncbi:MAG: DUF2339 domain-containing protein [Verrucomicrobiota bacterium]|nr:DUF2339 domain-containing protein [Verrucomicrobiota bacterium]
MDTLIGCGVLLALATLSVPFILSIVHARRIKTLETAVAKLTRRIDALQPGAVASAVPSGEAAQPAPVATDAMRTAHPAAVPSAKAPLLVSQPPIVTPPVVSAAAPKPAAPPKPPKAAIDWEAFMGVKLFAWLGGFALFLGVVFLVKYSFENNFITPVMRIVIGAIIGSVLVAAGWFTARRNYRVPGQSLCATGVLVLYADVFGAHAFYGLVSLGVAFVLMTAITFGAFFLAVTMNAQVVVVLGLVGGFLTPLLLTTGEHPLPTFGYIALLNFGIAAVALRKRSPSQPSPAGYGSASWDYLFLLAALGTVAIESLWVPIHNADQMTLGFPIFLGLQAQFLAFAYLRQRLQPNEKWSTSAAALVGFASIVFAFVLLGFPTLASRTGFFFGFTFLADIGLLALAMWRPNPARIAALAGTAVFALLSAWTASYLTHALLWWALGAYLLFALLHAGFSVWPARAEAKSPRTN